MPIGINNSSMKTGKGKMNLRTILSTTAEASVTIATNMHYIMIENIGNKIIYIGETGVTTTAYSMYLTPKESKDFGEVGSDFNFYMICGSALASTLGVAEYA